MTVQQVEISHKKIMHQNTKRNRKPCTLAQQKPLKNTQQAENLKHFYFINAEHSFNNLKQNLTMLTTCFYYLLITCDSLIKINQVCLEGDFEQTQILTETRTILKITDEFLYISNMNSKSFLIKLFILHMSIRLHVFTPKSNST